MNMRLGDLNRKHVYITGVFGGIGSVVAEKYLEQGAFVTGFDLRIDQRSPLESHSSFSSLQVDIADPSDIDNVFTCVPTSEEFGVPDVLVNCAGAVMEKSATSVTAKEWQKIVDVNYTGTFHMAKNFANVLLKEGKPGAIVNIASMSGHVSNYPQHQASYNSSKAAVIQLSKSLAGEWADCGIRVNSVSPGYVDTEMTTPAMRANSGWQDIWFDRLPIKRLAKPEEIANAILFLSSEVSAYTTGADLVIDGGYTIW